MLKIEISMTLLDERTDRQAVKDTMEAVAQAFGSVKAIRVLDKAPDKPMRGTIAACLGVRLSYADGVYSVESADEVRRYEYAHNAANGFAETIGECLRRRINAAGIPYPMPDDLANARPGTEEYDWNQTIQKQENATTE